MSVNYVGRVTTFRGKRLFNILCRLKNFGVGRMVYRNTFHERYPEPSYYVITQVEPDMSDPIQETSVFSSMNNPPHKWSVTNTELRLLRRQNVTNNDFRGAIPSKAWGFKVFRGQKMGETMIYSSFKPDWRLVPRDYEEDFIKHDGPERLPNIIPDEVPFPPLMERMILQDRKNEGFDVKEPIRLKLDIHKNKWNTAITESEIEPFNIGVSQEKS